MTGDKDRATRLAVGAGHTIGYLMILGGVYMTSRLSQLFNGEWLGFLGWFLAHAPEMEWRRVTVGNSIAGGAVSKVMSRDCPSVPGDTSLAEFVEHFLLRDGRRCYMVGESEAPRGIITLSDALSVPRDCHSGFAQRRHCRRGRALRRGTDRRRLARLPRA